MFRFTERAALAGVVLGLLLGTSSRVEAGLIIYHDSTSFQAATTGLSNINFNGVIPAGQTFQGFGIPPGYTDAATGTNFTFDNPGTGNINVTASNFCAPTIFSADFLNASVGVPSSAHEIITLPGSYTAVSLLYSTFNQQSFLFSFSNGQSHSESSTPAFGTEAFLGFTSTAPFSSLSVSVPSDNDGLILVGLQFGTVVPEPSTLIIAGVALLPAAWFLRRSRGRRTK